MQNSRSKQNSGTKIQSDAKTAVAVGLLALPGVEKFKDMGLLFIRDPVSVIRNADSNTVPRAFG